MLIPIFCFCFKQTDGMFVDFETYNGWLEDLQLESISQGADIRRVVMTRAERYLHEKAAGIKEKVKDNSHEKRNQHEMIICLECTALTFKRYVLILKLKQKLIRVIFQRIVLTRMNVQQI